MAGNRIELFRDLFSLHGNLLALLADKRQFLDQRFKLLFQPIH